MQHFNLSMQLMIVTISKGFQFLRVLKEVLVVGEKIMEILYEMIVNFNALNGYYLSWYELSFLE